MAILSIIIPAYNEEDAIAEIIERVLRAKINVMNQVKEISNVEVILVNDGSEDETASIASKYEQITVITHPLNRGYGAALKTGFESAKGEYLAFLDADGTYPPESLPELCQALIKNDLELVIATRMVHKGNGMPLQRKIGNKLFAYLLSWIIGEKITDTASGMRVFKASVYPRLLPLPDGLNFTPAMSTRALCKDLKMQEIPIHYDERIGRSKLNAIRDGFRFLKTIVGIARLYNPLKFFCFTGLLMLLLAAFLGVEPVLYYLTVRRVEDWEIYRLLAIMVLSVTGINFISFGAFSNFVLVVMHGMEIKAKGILSQFLLNQSFFKKFNILGIILILSSIILNYRTILQYLGTGTVDVHWSYVLTGAFLFLTGNQLMMLSSLAKALRGLAEERKLFAIVSASKEYSLEFGKKL